MTNIETRHFHSADEFVKALRRSDPYWLPGDHWQSPWIFRGQREADWKLIPSAWRDDVATDDLYQSIDASNVDGLVQQVISNQQRMGVNIEQHGANVRRLVVQNKFEFVAAHGFSELVDDLGLPLPGGRPPRTINYDPFRWMIETEPFHPTVALAQHHGMRTRLLDWTHNPLIAAFFAAEGAEVSSKGNIVVWAASRPLLLLNDCKEFTVQRSQIGYLHAQEGLFTYSLIAENAFLIEGTWPPLEELLPAEALRRVTLPKSQVPELLRLLWAERISKAHLMPSLDNVSQALRSVWKAGLKREVKESTGGAGEMTGAGPSGASEPEGREK